MGQDATPCENALERFLVLVSRSTVKSKGMGYTAKCVGLLSSFLQTQGGGIKMVVKYD